MDADTTTPQPSQTASPLEIALELGLTLVPFESEEWIGVGGNGHTIKTRNLYWLKGANMHSGPFKDVDQALNFIHHWYKDFYLRYQQGEYEDIDQ